MTITQKQTGSALEIALEGRLDTMTAPDLDNALKACLDSADSLTLDCENLDYVSSAGLRVFLSAHKALTGKGGLRLIHLNEIVREVLDVTGFSDILTIE